MLFLEGRTRVSPGFQLRDGLLDWIPLLGVEDCGGRQSLPLPRWAEILRPVWTTPEYRRPLGVSTSSNVLAFNRPCGARPVRLTNPAGMCRILACL